MNIDLDKFIKYEIYEKYIKDYHEKLKEKNLKIENDTLYLFSILTDDQIRKIINDNLNLINKLIKEQKPLKIIQEVLDSNFFTFYEIIPEEIKENEDELNILLKQYKSKNKKEKINLIIELNKINLSEKGLLDFKNKLKYISIAIEDEKIKENQKLALVIKGLPLKECLKVKNELSVIKEKTKKEAYLNNKLEKNNKIKTSINDKQTHLYNQEYYNFIENNNIPNNKLDLIKYAYFKQGINLDDFRNDLNKEFYNCSQEQLKNYIDSYTKYKDGFLNKEEYTTCKKIIKDNYISQEDIEETILPTIEKYNISEKQIKECIAISVNQDNDVKNYINLVIIAKKNHYSDFEINELLDDCKYKNKENTFLKTKMIKEYGNKNITNIDNLNNYDEKEMEYLLNNKDVAKNLNNSKEPTYEQLNL